MEHIKKHPTDMMKDVVKNYRGCGHTEYYGMLVWRDGLQYCRNCIYDIWAKESKWKPTEKDLRFPLYEDGVDYYGEEGE